MCEVGVAVEVPNRGYFGAELGSGGCFCLGRPNLRIRSMSVAAAFVAIFHSYWHIAYLDELFQRATRQTRAVHCQRMGDTACAIDGVISVVSARVLQAVWVDWTGSKAFVGDVSADTSQREPQPQRVLYPCTGPHATQHTCIQLRIAWLRMRRSRSSRGQCGGGLVEASEAAWK